MTKPTNEAVRRPKKTPAPKKSPAKQVVKPGRPPRSTQRLAPTPSAPEGDAAKASTMMLLATTRPSFLPDLPASSASRREPALLGEVLPALFRCGFPHLRFVDPVASTAPVTETQDMFFGPWAGIQLLRPASVWSRFARVYAGSVMVLSSNPARRAFTKEGKTAMENDERVARAEVPDLIARLLSVPASLRSWELTEDFVYGLEALCGPEIVCDSVLAVFERPPRGTFPPQMAVVTDTVALALGFVRLRLGIAARKEIDQRLARLPSTKGRGFPLPTTRIEALLDAERAARAPARYATSAVSHTTDPKTILAALTAFRPASSPLDLLDPRLVFLGGADAIPVYLSKFAEYERALHPNVAARQLAAFVDAIAPFEDARVGAWLESIQRHPHVGARAAAWLRARGPKAPPARRRTV